MWSQDKVDFDGVHYKLRGASIAPKPVQPDLPMWIGGSSEAAIRRTARLGTGWQAGPETPAQAREVVAAIKQAAAEAGRTIDDDHYGAGIPYRFGSPDDPALAPLFEAYRKRTGRDPKDYFAIGDAEAIVAKIADYVEAGVSKFILRPSAQGRRRDHGADAASDRGGTAARRRVLAETSASGARRRSEPPLQRLDLDLAELDHALLLVGAGALLQRDHAVGVHAVLRHRRS